MKAEIIFLMGLMISGNALAHGGDGHPSTVQQEEKTAHASALGAPGDPASVTRTVEVSMSDTMRFKPENIRVKQGETIRFVVKNTGVLMHEMVLGTMHELKEHAAMMRKSPEMKHADPNAVTVMPGKSGELIWHFVRPGRFDFACLIPGHLEAGMTGKVRVRE